MKRSILLFLLFCFLFISDNYHHIPKTFIIQPTDNIDNATLDFVLKRLKSHYPYISKNKSLYLPKDSYNKRLKGYDAETILNKTIEFVKPFETYVILTQHDICLENKNQGRMDILGLAQCPGKACICSYHRLLGIDTEEQFYKIVIHEIGHTLGLKHCNEKGCYMQNDQGVNHTYLLDDLCYKCKKVFIKNGWRFGSV